MHVIVRGAGRTGYLGHKGRPSRSNVRTALQGNCNIKTVRESRVNVPLKRADRPIVQVPEFEERQSHKYLRGERRAKCSPELVDSALGAQVED